MSILKKLAGVLLIPLTRWYLRKERRVEIEGITITVLPGVFHPGLFPSTRFLIDHIKSIDLNGKHVLELGCGTGLISIFCFTKGARVVASDISKLAVENATLNSRRRNADIKIVHSDLFDSIPSTTFDLIIINPPYYRAAARNEEELAWNCGPAFEYFHKLFQQLGDYTHEGVQVIMVLTKGCDIESIVAIARQNNFRMDVVREKKVLFDEKDYIFSVASTQLSHAKL